MARSLAVFKRKEDNMKFFLDERTRELRSEMCLEFEVHKLDDFELYYLKKLVKKGDVGDMGSIGNFEKIQESKQL